MASLFENTFAKLYSKTNKRYVNTFVPIKRDLPKGKTELNEDETEVYNTLKRAVKNIEHIAEKYPVIKEINEILYLKVLDHKDLIFTITVEDGKAEVDLGYYIEKKPSYVIPLYSHNVVRLEEVSSDDELDINEIYRITRVMFLPFLQGLYNGDYSQMPKDKSYMKLDNFIHVEVKGPEGVEVEGFEGPARATVVNVDGQWLIFEGFQGDPDIKYEMNIQQALKFAYLISVKIIGGAKKGASLQDLMGFIKAYNDLKDEVQIYERDWHTEEEYRNKN